MNKNILKYFVTMCASTLLLAACEGGGGSKTGELTKIETHDEKIVYNFNDEFVAPGVTAYYSNNKTAEVADKCTFDGFNSKKAGNQEIAVFYTENGVTQGTTYSVKIKNEVLVFDSLEVSNPKTEYEYNEEFVKPTVYVKYTNNSREDVTNSCTFNGYNKALAGTQTITVIYNFKGENKTTNYQVTVASPSKTATSLEITGTPKTEYDKGEEFEQPSVEVTFSDSTTADVSAFATFSGYNTSTTGTQTVTVSYTYFSGNTVTTTYQITVSEPVSKVKFAIFADVQLCNDTIKKDGSKNIIANVNTGTTANAPIALKNHLQFCKNEGITTILMNGDVTNQANEFYYQHFNKILKEVYGTDESKYPEFVWNIGNHEWWYGVSEKETGDAVSIFENYARIDSANLIARSAVPYSNNNEINVPSYYKVINGVPFIVISAESSAGNVGTALRAEIETWLGQAKDLDSVKAGGPIFVEYHYALSTSMTHGQGSSTTTSTVEDIFKNTPNAVIFTGDTHYPGVNERAINQVDFTTINLGSSSYSRMVDSSAVLVQDYYNVEGGGTSKSGDIMQGNVGFMEAYTPSIQVVDVSSKNTFKIDRYFTSDGGTGTHIGQQWKFGTIKSKADFKYTNARFQNVESAQELYGANGLSWENGDKVTFGINPDTHRATVMFKDVTDFHYVEHYKIEINNQTFNLVSNYATNPSERTNNYYILDNISEAQTYNVKVTAYDFFDNESLNYLSSSTNEVGLAVDEIDNSLMQFPYPDISARLNVESKANEDSHSSLEYYYKGIQEYIAGATCVRPIETGKQFDVTDKFTFNDASDTKPVFKFKAKVTTKDNLIVGISVVNGGTWKTDFGSDVQKSLLADGLWHEYEYDLNALFGVTKKSDLSMLQIKVKSTASTSDGYEMGVLFDDIDIVNTGGSTPVVERGEAFFGSTGYQKEIDPSANITFDVKFNTGNTTKIALALVDTKAAENWGAYFGYVNIYPTTKTGDIAGITVKKTKDGYMRFIIDVTLITEKSGAPVNPDIVYFREGWSTADGLVDINPTYSELEPEYRGEAFTAGVNWNKNITKCNNLTIDIYFANAGGNVAVALVDEEKASSWSAYFGYYDLKTTTKTGDFAGITVKKTKDGYMRFIIDVTQLSKKSGSPEQPNVVYFRDMWTSTGGYVEINPTYNEIEKEYRGEAFTAGVNWSKDLSPIALTTPISFDIYYTTDETTKINFVFGQGWSNYFGYFDITPASKTNDYPGMTVEKLTDDYIRYTFDLSKATKINGTKPTEINLIHFKGSNTTASGYVAI